MRNIFRKRDPGDKKSPRDFGNIGEYKNYGRNPIECIVDPSNREPVIFETDDGYEIFNQRAIVALTDDELGKEKTDTSENRRIFAVLERNEKKYIFEIAEQETELFLRPITDNELCKTIYVYAESNESETEDKQSGAETILTPADALRSYLSKYGREGLTEKKQLREYLLAVIAGLREEFYQTSGVYEQGIGDFKTVCAEFSLLVRGVEYGICSAYLRAAERYEKQLSTPANRKKERIAPKEAELEYCRIEDRLCGGIGISDRDAEKFTGWIKSALGIE